MTDERAIDARMARLRQLTAPVAFQAGFADRVMARLERQPSLADGLQAVFVRLAPLAAAAALIIAAANLVNTRSSGQPFVERVLNLQAVTVNAAYALEFDLAVRKEQRP